MRLICKKKIKAKVNVKEWSTIYFGIGFLVSAIFTEGQVEAEGIMAVGHLVLNHQIFSMQSIFTALR